jgi:hypothetical protein
MRLLHAHVHGPPANGEYMYSVHGSITLGQRLARSARATTMLTRTGGDTSLQQPISQTIKVGIGGNRMHNEEVTSAIYKSFSKYFNSLLSLTVLCPPAR